MEKVIVLLSTYNGEKYIEEQIKSLLNQVDVDVHILIRDDGSKDGTLNIVEKMNDGRIEIYSGENLKPAKSFLQLVKMAGDSEYYAFCDQDDVWDDNKLITAVNMMKDQDSNKPILYMSTYDVVDSDLNFLFKRNMEFDIPFKLQTTIMERSPSGCTMVFNKNLKQLIEQSNPKNLRMHDFWTLMVAEAFHAMIITDDNSRLKYRQHENNVVGLGTPWRVKIKRLIFSMLYEKNERQKQAVSLLQEYESILPEDSKQILEEVAQYREKIFNRFKLAFNKDYRLNSSYINLLFIFSVLIGVF